MSPRDPVLVPPSPTPEVEIQLRFRCTQLETELDELRKIVLHFLRESELRRDCYICGTIDRRSRFATHDLGRVSVAVCPEHIEAAKTRWPDRHVEPISYDPAFAELCRAVGLHP